MQKASVLPCAKFLADLKQGTNESQKRHLFTTLAATGFGEGEYGYQRKGNRLPHALRLGAPDTSPVPLEQEDQQCV